MIRLWVCTLGVALLLCFVPPAISLAADSPGWSLLSPQEVNFTLEGKITRQTPGKLTVASVENIIFRVRYDDKTEIKRKDGSAASAQDLRVGVEVRVEGDLTEAGEVLAARIELLSEPASKRR